MRLKLMEDYNNLRKNKTIKVLDIIHSWAEHHFWTDYCIGSNMFYK